MVGMRSVNCDILCLVKETWPSTYVRRPNKGHQNSGSDETLQIIMPTPTYTQITIVHISNIQHAVDERYYGLSGGCSA